MWMYSSRARGWVNQRKVCAIFWPEGLYGAATLAMWA
jgi:hypothetical protein